MTFDEVKLWADHHDTRFNGFLKWLSKQPNPDGVVQFWSEQLRHVSLLDATLASNNMFESEVWPPCMGHHVKELKRTVRNIEADRVKSQRFARFGEPTKDCPHCSNGAVRIALRRSGLCQAAMAYHERHKHDNDKAEPEIGPTPAVCACSCGAGDRFFELHNCVRYQAGVHALWNEHLESKRRAKLGIEPPEPATPADTQLLISGSHPEARRAPARLPQPEPEPAVAASVNSGEGLPF